MFGRRAQRFFAVTAGVLLALGLVLNALYLWSPHATLHMTSGFPGAAAQKFVSAFVAGASAHYSRLRIELVLVNSFADSSRAMEDGKVDIAIVRTDIAPPTNGATVAILRRDSVAIVVAAESPVKSVADLAGRTIAIPQSLVQVDNSGLLDSILAYFDVPGAAHDLD